jgi:hypothetical protein
MPGTWQKEAPVGMPDGAVFTEPDKNSVESGQSFFLEFVNAHVPKK